MDDDDGRPLSARAVLGTDAVVSLEEEGKGEGVDRGWGE